MFQKFYDTDDFIQMQKHWYAALRKELPRDENGETVLDYKRFGLKDFRVVKKIKRMVEEDEAFQDIESFDDIRFNSVRQLVVQVEYAQVRHFEACSDFLNSGNIKNKTEDFVFYLYCQGKSTRDIELYFSKNFPLKGIKKTAIHSIVLKILEQANIKPYSFNF